MILTIGAELAGIDYFTSIRHELLAITELDFIYNELPGQTPEFSSIQKTAHFLGFGSCPSIKWRTLIFEKLLLPEMKRCVQDSRYNDLLSIEQFIYNYNYD